MNDTITTIEFEVENGQIRFSKNRKSYVETTDGEVISDLDYNKNVVVDINDVNEDQKLILTFANGNQATLRFNYIIDNEFQHLADFAVLEV
jgi:rRNA processing protein Krr1/Pno1